MYSFRGDSHMKQKEILGVSLGVYFELSSSLKGLHAKKWRKINHTVNARIGAQLSISAPLRISATPKAQNL